MTLAIAEGIMLAVYRETGITPADLRGKDRHRHVVQARQAVALAVKERTEWSYPQVGKLLGRDHSTIIHGIETATERALRTPSYRQLLDILREAPAIAPGYLNAQIQRVANGLDAVLAGECELVTASEIRTQAEELAARGRAERKAREEAERAEAAERNALFDAINDDGRDWENFQWRGGSKHSSWGGCIGDDGDDQADKYLRGNVIKGSQRLLAALLEARAA